MPRSTPIPSKDSGHDLQEKLIEVALPLEAINKASARAKSIRHWHPSTLHPFDRFTLWLIWPKLQSLRVFGDFNHGSVHQ